MAFNITQFYRTSSLHSDQTPLTQLLQSLSLFRLVICITQHRSHNKFAWPTLSLGGFVLFFN